MKLDLFYEFCQGRPYMTQVGADRELFDTPAAWNQYALAFA